MPFHSAGFPIDNVKNPRYYGHWRGHRKCLYYRVIRIKRVTLFKFKKIVLSFEQNTNEIKEQV